MWPRRRRKPWLSSSGRGCRRTRWRGYWGAGLLGIPERELRALGITAVRRGKQGKGGEATGASVSRLGTQAKEARLAS